MGSSGLVPLLRELFPQRLPDDLGLARPLCLSLECLQQTHRARDPLIGLGKLDSACLHVLLSVVCFVLAMTVWAPAFSGWVRILSIEMRARYVLLAVVRLATANADYTSGATSMIGTQERTLAYSFLMWVMALAVYLLTSIGKVESAS